jgi:hypothetical protein
MLAIPWPDAVLVDPDWAKELLVTLVTLAFQPVSIMQHR